MKKVIISIALFALMLVFFTVCILAQFSNVNAQEETDYMAVMMSAVVSGDTEKGVCAENARKNKITFNELTDKIITYEDLSYLSKIIYAEAGSYWLSDTWKMCVGEVVLNRVNSPEFPDTIKDVIEQEGQYYGANSNYFRNLNPSMRCVELARKLLNGERVMYDDTVVFQANFKQGGGACLALYDKYLGWTYFCYSTKLELYDCGSKA